MEEVLWGDAKCQPWAYYARTENVFRLLLHLESCLWSALGDMGLLLATASATHLPDTSQQSDQGDTLLKKFQILLIATGVLLLGIAVHPH